MDTQPVTRGVPRCRTQISRFELYAVVTIENERGEILTTTMGRDIQASDLAIARLKCQLNHVSPKEAGLV